MRPPKQASAVRWIIFAVLVLSLVSQSVIFGAPRASRRNQLQHRKANLQTKIRHVRSQIRKTEIKMRQTTSQLREAERRTRIARGLLQYEVIRYERSKIELHRATLALKDAKADYANAQNDAKQHVVAMYERGDKGYTDLLVTSKDYGEALQRAQLARYLMLQDNGVLDDLKARKEKVSHYQSAVRSKTAEVAAHKEQVAYIHEQANRLRLRKATEVSSVARERDGLAAELDALERDSASVSAMLRRMQSSVAGHHRFNTVYHGTLGGLWPVRGARITSGFGYRVHPVTGVRRLHTGVDLAAPMGTPIVSTGGGEVIYAGWRGGYGNAVIIDHGKGRATLYGHMSAVLVHAGQVVARGQQIGRVGSTGMSTGPHCHYELRINGKPVSPF